MQMQPTIKPPKKIVSNLNSSFLELQNKTINEKINNSVNKTKKAISQSYYMTEIRKQNKLINHYRFISNEY